MKEKIDLKMMVCMVLLSVFLRMIVSAAQESVLQQGIAGEVLRFHILANSDSEEDQDIKLKVRDNVLKWIQEGMEEEQGNADLQDRTEVEHFLSCHLTQIQEITNQSLQELGVSYQAQAELVHCYFPMRTYGDCTFPAGWYEALRISLGEGQGHNWWCVLFPRLCFADCLHAVVAEEEKKELEELLTVEEYEHLLQTPAQWKIAFRWF